MHLARGGRRGRLRVIAPSVGVADAGGDVAPERHAQARRRGHKLIRGLASVEVTVAEGVALG